MRGTELKRNRRGKIAIIILIGIVSIGGLYLLSLLEPSVPPVEEKAPPPLGALLPDVIREAEVLKEDDFEYEKKLDFPEKWGASPNTPGSHHELEWYLELPVCHVETSEKIAKTGERSVHIWNTPGERSVLLAATFEDGNIDIGKRAIETWFYLDDGFDEPYTGIWLCIDQCVLNENSEPDGVDWKNRIVGIGADGSIFYGKGYTYEPEDDPALEYFMGDFKLSQKTWYWARMVIDFDKADGYITLRGEDGLEKDFYIPDMDQRIGHKLVDFNFSSYYFGVSHLPFTHSKHAYFDDVKCSLIR
jgi:hypothetical protein